MPLAPVVLKDRGEADPAGPSCGSLSVDSSSGAQAGPLFLQDAPLGTVARAKAVPPEAGWALTGSPAPESLSENEATLSHARTPVPKVSACRSRHPAPTTSMLRIHARISPPNSRTQMAPLLDGSLSRGGKVTFCRPPPCLLGAQRCPRVQAAEGRADSPSEALRRAPDAFMKTPLCLRPLLLALWGSSVFLQH